MLQKIDKVLFWLTVALIVIGVLMFASASLGIISKSTDKFVGVLISQIVFGVGGGIVLFFVTVRIKYTKWKEYSPILLVISIISILLLYVPGLGYEHGGATRWLNVFGVSFQPVELFKVAIIFFVASYLSKIRSRVNDWKVGLLPLGLVLIFSAALLLPQPDTKSLVLIGLIAFSMYFVAGIKWKYIIIAATIGIALLGYLVVSRPYVADRFTTFLNPSQDEMGASWQLNQSLMAFVSGGIFGNGLGQSLQKFSYLPEPQGDSIFAVIGEELGLIGSVVIVGLYVAMALRIFKNAANTKEYFGKYILVGFGCLVFFQSFMNIASSIGLIPLTGVPLVFMSHGGTSLMISFASMGVVMNVTKYTELGV